MNNEKVVKDIRKLPTILGVKSSSERVGDQVQAAKTGGKGYRYDSIIPNTGDCVLLGCDLAVEKPRPMARAVRASENR